MLEPSAGYGDLADAIKDRFRSIYLDCVELNSERCDALKRRGHNVVCRDFFRYEPQHSYDFIIAAPNFRDNVDIDHIMHMWSMLAPNGTIVSLTAPEWIASEGERETRWREWLYGKDYSLKMLVDNSFVEDGKSRPTMILTLKRGEQ